MFKERGNDPSPESLSIREKCVVVAVCLSVYPHFRSHAELQTELCTPAFSSFETKEAVLLVERLTCIRWHHLITSLMVKWRLLRRIPETIPPEPLQRSTTAPLNKGPHACSGARGTLQSSPGSAAHQPRFSRHRYLQRGRCRHVCAAGRSTKYIAGLCLSANSKHNRAKNQKGSGLCTL